jgi:L-ascorbate metabolism protein UlaG (beta-lactamase superfamily)
LGHATVLAEIDSTVVLADPIFSQRASYVQWMGPKRYRPAACTVKQLPDKLDVVIVSHTHYDHLDHNSVQQLLERCAIADSRVSSVEYLVS